MSIQQKDEQEAKTHRLIDMIVEEVSLVDRAANKHRFLVVKRDKPMADKNKKKNPKTAKPAEDPEAGAEGMKKAIGDALGIATTALEALTNAIEQLGQVGDADSTPIVSELAEELAEVAGQLASSAGVESPEVSGEVSAVVDGVRAMLSEVSGLLASSAEKNTDDVQSAAESTAAAETPAAAPDASSEVGKQLASVATSLRGLTDVVKEQAQRLSKLEKGVGLPNSRQAPEAPDTRVAKEDVSWPLDMNRPMDRESVDKTVSFHDR
jgi:hypothetical protein